MPDDPLDTERTEPNPSRWDQEGAEYVRSNEEWVVRFARQMVIRWSDVGPETAYSLAQELSLDDNLRALNPEIAAEGMVSPTGKPGVDIPAGDARQPQRRD